MEKLCGQCGKTKTLSEFNRNKSNPDGLDYQCRACKKLYYLKNRGIILKKKKEEYEIDGEAARERTRKWHKENKDRSNELNNNWYIKKYHNDPLFRFEKLCRCRIQDAFRRLDSKKSKRSLELLGADWETVQRHIEQQFVEGMTWKNYGEWQADHVIPLVSANNKEELIPLLHYTNLQPLWALDNNRKGSKMDLGDGETVRITRKNRDKILVV